MIHIIDVIADERDRLREQVASLKLEIVALKRNQCGEQVGWFEPLTGRSFPMAQKPHESHKPEAVYRRASK